MVVATLSEARIACIMFCRYDMSEAQLRAMQRGLRASDIDGRREIWGSVAYTLSVRKEVDSEMFAAVRRRMQAELATMVASSKAAFLVAEPPESAVRFLEFLVYHAFGDIERALHELESAPESGIDHPETSLEALH